MYSRKSKIFGISGISGILAVSIILLTSGCLDTIDIETPASNAESLVIQGKLVLSNPATVEVKISRLFNFTAEGKRPVNAQSVTLFDEDGNSIDLEDNGLGAYQRTLPANDPGFPVDVDRSYGIRIRTFDNRTFESAMEKGSAVPEIEGLNFRIVERELINAAGTTNKVDFLQYSVTTPLRTSEASGNVRLGWEYMHTFKVNDTPISQNVDQKVCYVTENLNVTDISVIDAAALSADRLSDYALYETMTSRVYGEGLYFTLIQESLSETAYEYFSQVAENTGRTGNMFESPPGKVVTNIRNVNDESDEAFGFFYVTQQDTIRQYINPELVGAPPAYCPPPQGLTRENGSCADALCCDCLSVPNSTVQKPAYWTE
ncbi:DUF4249 family protein [Flavilitoribacter nigricans]|nr:DUF4249 family protein [Flavilitoribacter nigricans]